MDPNSAEGHEGLGTYFASYEYDWSRADEQLARARVLNGGQTSTVRKADADAALARFTHEFGSTQPEGVAEVYAARKDPTKAFEWLDKAYSQRDSELLWARICPCFDPCMRMLAG
jgi:hypothetical protein